MTRADYSRNYRKKRKEKGICITCGKARNVSVIYCDEHLIKNRERLRKLYGFKKRYYGAKSYCIR
jgi:hypothetical protein